MEDKIGDCMRAAVIGAGPAGSAAAYNLAKSGAEVVVLERGEAIGGRTRSIRSRDFVLDTGAGLP